LPLSSNRSLCQSAAVGIEPTETPTVAAVCAFTCRAKPNRVKPYPASTCLRCPTRPLHARTGRTFPRHDGPRLTCHDGPFLPRLAEPSIATPRLSPTSPANPALPFRTPSHRVGPSPATPAKSCRTPPYLASTCNASPALPYPALACRTQPCPVLPCLPRHELWRYATSSRAVGSGNVNGFWLASSIAPKMGASSWSALYFSRHTFASFIACASNWRRRSTSAITSLR
jgi:hypothetical protein